MREHAEVCLQRLRGIQVVPIPPPPPKRRALRLFEPREVDPSFGERLQLVERIVGADDTDQLHGRQVTRRRGKKVRRAAEYVIRLSEGSLDGVEGDGADYENSHDVRSQESGVRSQGVSGEGDRGTVEKLLSYLGPGTPCLLIPDS
jgi:hypothetical protein